jgi:hypothetical protein
MVAAVEAMPALRAGRGLFSDWSTICADLSELFSFFASF